ncbi:MAG: methylenetetrahydrofolate--tRNA-(uracil(54)-C(5))-methyltransferase (FADH(2)-oxidizing) TrmFO [Clostridia bacterium]|nr:methylenetetrahydrofolate--tRNA-(uracil(54)-C(5))-methyltransferase (FADH(2)-oxidizing) TrmFO [Clostridia bacterium]
MNQTINIVGAGLAGCEAAYQAAKRGVKVNLYECKPTHMSPAHHLESFAELVCSNSLRADNIENASGLLKHEMRKLDSLILSAADASAVPAGGALAVDRHKFTQYVTDAIKSNPNITVINKLVDTIPDDGSIWIIATGPLTCGELPQYIKTLIGDTALYFYDAAAPIVDADSIDMSIVYCADRYGKGDGDYLNCPMDKQQYIEFRNALLEAEQVELHSFENMIHFEGCMPIEALASRGEDTMRFGPLKPVGLTNPRTGREDYACVQLRKENKAGTMYNLVGFQTNLKWPEQKRVFGMIPGLKDAAYLRYGVMHRNTFIKSPGRLDSTYRLKTKPNIYFAGQITGVEGYIESTSSGLVAGINAARAVLGQEPVEFPACTVIGALAHHASDYAGGDFQPMKANFGIVDTEKFPKVRRQSKMERYQLIAQNSLDIIQQMITE